MADGPAGFRRGFPCPALLRIRLESRSFLATGLLPHIAGLSRPLHLNCCTHIDVLQPQGASSLVWAVPRSLAATQGITFVFFSSRYLDVSVPWVCLQAAMYSLQDTWALPHVGFPIRTSPDQSLLTAPRGVSSFATSFVGSWRLGILRALLLA